MVRVLDKNKAGRLITKGDHYEVREYGKDKVIKIPLVRTDRYPGPLQSRENYLLLKRYVGDYLPQTEFVFDKRYKQPLVIQERIKGRALREIKWEKIKKSETFRKNLFKLIKGIIKLEEKTGKIAEVFGKGKFWWRNSPKDTDNIIFNKKGKPFLVDVFLLDPKEINLKWWQLRRRWLLWSLKQSLEKMKKDLEEGRYRITSGNSLSITQS